MPGRGQDQTFRLSSSRQTKNFYMKRAFRFSMIIAAAFLAWSCNNTSSKVESTTTENANAVGQSAVQDSESAKDVVKVAVGSQDHTTLVAAIKQAELVDALSNAGPFTVFAPTNEAFDTAYGPC